MTVEHRTPWSTQLTDRTDNILVLSAYDDFTGELMDANPDAYNPRVTGSRPDWFYEAIETFPISDRDGPPSRRGDYYVQETVVDVWGGVPPVDAVACVWSHVEVGDQGNALWDDACEALPADFSDATPGGTARRPAYALQYLDSPLPFVGSSVRGEETKVARGAWFIPVRDNLPPYGVLDPFNDIDLIAAGLPADYIGTVLIEYEDEFTELVQVDVAGDRQDHGDSDAEATRFHVNTDLDVLPAYGDGAWESHWSIGPLGVEVVPPPPTRKSRFTYNGGTPTWNWLSAFTAWDDCSSWPADSPDVIAGLELDLPSPPTIDSDATGDTDIAFRFTLRASRFRLVYFVDEAPVIRQYPREDGRGLSSAPRLYPPTKANRLAGGYM